VSGTHAGKRIRDEPSIGAVQLFPRSALSEAHPSTAAARNCQRCGEGLVRGLAIASVAWSLTLPVSVLAEVEGREQRDAKLAREFNDPLTELPQLFVQDAYTPASYGTEAQTNRVIARLIVPRVPRFSLFPFVQLIRPSLSLATAPTGRGSATRTELGDMQLFDLAVIPWPGEQSGLLMGVGAVFVFPTATRASAGQGAWQVGPAFGAIYKGLPGILLGCLLQNPISFAYTSANRQPVNTLLVQPILLRHVWRGLYVKSADATWAFGWRNGSPTTLPLSLGLGYVIPRQHAPPLNFFVSGEWMAFRRDAPIAARTTVRFGFTVAFPGLRVW
jgi:hypothetical protein